MMRRISSVRRDDDGVALILVIGICSVLAALMVAAIAVSVGSLRAARNTQDWNGALAAAYAGIEEYQSRLANDTGYFAFGNPASTFSHPDPAVPATVTLPTGASANAAFGIGTAGTWATVPGSGGSASYRYEVDNTKFGSDGTLRLRATGRVGAETRSILADLKQQGFIDFLYFTDFEASDPTASNPTSTTNCAIYYPNSGWCGPIYFGSNDTISGPLHSNDAIHTNGAAHFEGKVTTMYDAPGTGPNLVSESTAPIFAITGDPQNVGKIGMPATNAQLKKETRSDLPVDVPAPGCLYTGPTSIVFNSGGTMTVISPWTKFTNTGNASDTAGTNPGKCGTPGATGLAKVSGSAYVGQTFAVPTNTVFYVQNVPSASSNVNSTPTSPSATKPPYTGAISCKSNGNSLGYPITNEDIPFTNAYGCRNGDLFVKGTLVGKVTLAAENYIYVTGDVKYATGEDMLGLIGNNAVWVWNPMDSNTPLLTPKNRRIDAAILSVAHTFIVQNYDKGTQNRGTLTVNGAIAQRFRGPVGTAPKGATVMTTGYAKDYNYDERFRYTAPPKFLSPVTTTYGVNIWIEISPVFDSTGAYR